MTTSDDLLRRVEWRAVVLTAAASLVTLVVPGGGARVAAGVLGGAAVSGLSYWAIKRGVTGIADRVAGRPSQEIPRSGTTFGPRGVVEIVLRYALLAGIAYVMIARLRLSPIGLLCGASMIPVAASVELIRRRR